MTRNRAVKRSFTSPEAEYDNHQETLALLSRRGFMASIRKSVKQIENGETFSVAEVFENAKIKR